MDERDAGLVFKGSPVWQVNLPLIVAYAGLLVLLMVTSAYGTLARWPLPWWIWAAVAAVLFLRVAYAAAITATTRIVIDQARVRFSYGLVTREVASVELFRIQNVQAVSNWWQSMLGFGTLVLETSDTWHPLWRVPGIADAAELRDRLNQMAVDLRRERGIGEVNFGRV
jgi:membrane protein YdbS with pleckstrin-like domain